MQRKHSDPGERLAALTRSKREPLRLSLTKLAELLAITRTTLSRIEAGRYFPSPKLLVNVARAAAYRPSSS